MKQILVDALNSVTVQDVEIPEPPAGEARVRMIYSGICGSDTHAAAGTHAFLVPPYIPGHEAIGVVDSVGEGVDQALIGKRVMLKPNITCGECITCKADRSNACQVLEWIGCDNTGKLPGAMSDYFLAPDDALYPLDDSISDEQGVLIECLATPIHAVRMAGGVEGKKVAIIGAGTIGVLQVIAALEAGAEKVVVTDLEETKRERAVRLGATGAVDGSAADFDAQVKEILGGPADVLFDCVTNEASARQWTKLVRRGSTICIVGVPAGYYPVPMGEIQDWELAVQGCANYNETDVEVAISMAQKIPADDIVSAVYPVEEGSQAFSEAVKFTSGKVLVKGSAAN